LAAWNNMQNSINYVTQSYAVNSLKAFQAKSIEEVGSEVCKAYISQKGPTVLKSLTEIESPPQFNAYFTSIKYSDATIPATAQYKVSYHIYAGKNAGVYYSVYLKDPPSSPYYSQTAYIQVASGFIKQGEYASESKDFTAPEGYQTLCVRINAEEECGFKQVSTSFAVNYVRDRYVSEQAKTADITTESGCVSGSPSSSSLLALANPNLQAGIEEAALPQVSNRGIVRICASTNPGQSVDPARYVEVGYCGDKNIKCWLDTRSVDNAITDNNVGMRDATLKEIEAKNLQLLTGKGEVIADDEKVFAEFNSMKEIQKEVIKSISNKVQVNDFKARVDALNEKLVYNHHKAELLLIWAEVEDEIARELLPSQTIFELDSKPVGQLLIVTKADGVQSKFEKQADKSWKQIETKGVGDKDFKKYSGSLILSSKELAKMLETPGWRWEYAAKEEGATHAKEEQAKAPEMITPTAEEESPELLLSLALDYDPRKQINIISSTKEDTKIYVLSRNLYLRTGSSNNPSNDVRLGALVQSGSGVYNISLIPNAKEKIKEDYYNYLNGAIITESSKIINPS
ncbi:MAG: hypothetical protein QXS38_01950, partial [Candidatus Pacearchaeota archaeon]